MVREHGENPSGSRSSPAIPGPSGICNASCIARLMDQVVPVLEASPRVFRYAWCAAPWKSNYGAPRHLGAIDADFHNRFAAYEAAASMPGNALNRETWSQLSDERPNNSWTAGYGDASWQIQTNAECVAAAEADAFVRDAPRPQHRLGRVLLRDGRLRRARRYELHDHVPLRRGRQGPRRRRRYENFTWESPCQPSRAPTLSPTSTPRRLFARSSKSLSSSSSSSGTSRGSVGCRCLVILAVGVRACDWSDRRTVLCGRTGAERFTGQVGPKNNASTSSSRTWAAVRGTTSARSLLGRIVGAVAQLQEKIAAEEPAGERGRTIDRRRRLRRLRADDGRGWLRRCHWCERCSQRKNSAEDKLPHHVYCLCACYW